MRERGTIKKKAAEATAPSVEVTQAEPETPVEEIAEENPVPTSTKEVGNAL